MAKSKGKGFGSLVLQGSAKDYIIMLEPTIDSVSTLATVHINIIPLTLPTSTPAVDTPTSDLYHPHTTGAEVVLGLVVALEVMTVGQQSCPIVILMLAQLFE